MTEAYLTDRIKQQVSKARELSSWLLDRIDELRQQGFVSDLNAQEKSAVRTTYDAFLARYTQAVQQESLPMVQAEIIASAVRPIDPDWPNKPIVLAGSLFLGLVGGFGIAILRDVLDRKIRSRQQLEQAARTRFLGFLPYVRLGSRAAVRARKRAGAFPASPTRTFSGTPQTFVSLTAPLSRFAETLRNVRMATVAANGGGSVLGVTSSRQGEGKTTIAINLARLIGETSTKVLLIDSDLRNPVLSRSLVSRDTPGLMQVLAGQANLAEVLWSDSTTSLRFLPAGTDVSIPGSSEILASHEIRALMEEIRDSFSFVVVDLPALLPVVDVHAAAHLFDALVLVVEWGVTTEDSIRDALLDTEVERKLIGTILNKVKRT